MKTLDPFEKVYIYIDIYIYMYMYVESGESIEQGPTIIVRFFDGKAFAYGGLRNPRFSSSRWPFLTNAYGAYGGDVENPA